MYYANIIPCDISNGTGIRVSLFVSGCQFHCKNCFNKELWNYEYGNDYRESTQELILNYLKKDYIKGLSILGGDSMCQSTYGLKQLIKLCEETHNLGKDIWIYTGFTFEELLKFDLDKPVTLYRRTLLGECDVLVDGQYIDELKDLRLKFRGSSNQRIINVPESLKQKRIILQAH